MSASVSGQQTWYTIDEHLYNEYSEIKQKNKTNPHHYSNKLETKDIFLFSIVMAVKNGRTPQPSKKAHWFTRTITLRDKDAAILNSLIFAYKKDISILFDENISKFRELAEKLANAGMPDVLQLLENEDETEKLILLESKKIKP